MDMEVHTSEEKDTMILSVARFEQGGSKKQLEMIKGFNRLKRRYPELTKDWKLVLAGGSSQDNPYLQTVIQAAKQSKAQPIEVQVNIPVNHLKDLYRKASIFWHLCGLDQTDPALVEHFGMTIAEAMGLGKPVIATDYAGNADYMNASNSYPVEYRLVELEQDYGPYQKGEVWADPDLDHAAAQMRRVFQDREEAVRKGMQAAADIKRWYGSEAMARKIIARLNAISSWPQ